MPELKMQDCVGRRVRLKPLDDCEDFPGGVPEEFGDLLSADDPCVVQVDDEHCGEGDDGLRECGLDQVELIRYRCKNCGEEFTEHPDPKVEDVVPGTDGIVQFVECCLKGILS